MGVLGEAELEAVVEEATVDTYTEDEQLTGPAEWIDAYRHWAG
jgi:hypothetical protein